MRSPLAHLLPGLPALLLGLLLDVLQRDLLQLTLLGLGLPLCQLLLGALVPDAAPLQVSARVKVGGGLAVASLAPQQRAEASLAPQKAQDEVKRAARGDAVAGKLRLVIELPASVHEALAGAGDALPLLRAGRDLVSLHAWSHREAIPFPPPALPPSPAQRNDAHDAAACEHPVTWIRALSVATSLLGSTS